MSKKKADINADGTPSGVSPADALSIRRSEFISKLAAKVSDDGGEVLSMEELRDGLRVIPFNCLPLEYLFGVNGMVCPGIVFLSGKTGTGKSTLGYHLLSKVIAQGGVGSLVDTEIKTSPKLARSMMGDDKSSFIYKHASTLESAQDMITDTIKLFRKEEAKFPLGVMWDSLVGARSRTVAEEIIKSGHSESGYAIEANLNSKYISGLSAVIGRSPTTLVITGHEKKSMDAGTSFGFKGGDDTHVPGGDAARFHASHHITVSSNATTGLVDKHHTKTLKTKKNSFGDTGRWLQVEFHWEDDDSGQRSWFDWDQALCELLVSDRLSKERVAKVAKVVKYSSTKWACRELDVVDAGPADVARALLKDPDRVDALRKALGIEVYTPQERQV